MVNPMVSTLNECKKYTNKIMSMISNLLESHGYEVNAAKSNNELVVQTPNLTKINDIIFNELDVPFTVKTTVIDTYETQSKVYIRLKFK